jgi:hypothetical protein
MRNTIELLMISAMGVLNLCCLCPLCSPALGAISSSNVLSSLAKPRIYLTVTNNPPDWLMYLRYINGYAAALKKKNDFSRIVKFNHDATL